MLVCASSVQGNCARESFLRFIKFYLSVSTYKHLLCVFVLMHLSVYALKDSLFNKLEHTVVARLPEGP